MIFITGCNGLVGSFVARKLIKEGYQIRALKRGNSDLTLVQDIAGQIEWIEGDILDLPGLSRAMAGVSVVIHSAAVISFAPADRAHMHKINVEGTANIVNVCLANNVRKLCHVSSVAALGRKKNDQFISEEAKWEHSSNNSNYAQTKYLAELEVWRGMAEGLPAVIVNPSIILGPGNWEQGSTKLFKYVWDEHAFYTGGSINYVDVRDVSQIIFQLIRSEITLERFILNGGNIKIKELFEKIATRFGKKPPSVPVNPLLTAVAWRLEHMRSLITGKDPLITRETAQIAQKDYIYMNEKVKQKLQYSFYPIEDTIEWTCRELSKHSK
jgi:nucleoside-diphosphate-sugar epimerase